MPPSYLVLDSSLSMGYSGGGGVTKLEYAIVLAASLAMMAFGQRDAVSVAHGAGEPSSLLPPRNSARPSAPGPADPGGICVPEGVTDLGPCSAAWPRGSSPAA